MTREEFIEVLEDKRYSYEIEGDKIVVTEEAPVEFTSLKTIPANVEFSNGGRVELDSLMTISPGVEFNNAGYVTLKSLNSLPSGMEFNNGGDVYLDSLKSLPSGVKFNNSGDIYLKSLNSISSGVEFRNKEGMVYSKLFRGTFGNSNLAIKGINSRELLNLMIKRSVFAV